jgi:hypothetical protein
MPTGLKLKNGLLKNSTIPASTLPEVPVILNPPLSTASPI